MPFNIPNPEEAITKVIDQVGGELKEKDKRTLEKALHDVIIHGKTPKEAFEMTAKDMECMYAYAYNLFTHGKYKDSLILMRHMLDLDPTNPRYPLACGAACQQMKNYERAAGYYLVAFHINREDPIPVYYMYECFRNMNDPLMALIMLDNVIAIAGDRPEHAILKERVMRTRSTLAEELNSREQEEEAKKNEA